MSLLVAIVVGCMVGLVASLFMFENADYLILNMLMGVVGSILGLAVYYLGFEETGTSSLFSWRATVCSILGAAIMVAILGVTQFLRANQEERGSIDSQT